MIADDKFCMKHLIFLLLLAFVSCSGEMGEEGSSSANNSKKPKAIDLVLNNANASTGLIGSVEEEGCDSGLSKLKVRSPLGEYYFCFDPTPGTNLAGRIGKTYCTKKNLTTCFADEIYVAMAAGLISADDYPYNGDRIFAAMNSHLGSAINNSGQNFTSSDYIGCDNGDCVFVDYSSSYTRDAYKKADFYCCHR